MTDLKDIKPTATATQAGAKRYNDFGTWLRSHFPFKVQKIAVDAGFTCPNRDGTLSSGGCTFCDNTTFNPKYCSPRKSITEQLEEGKDFFARKYPEMKFLAYFQAYSNTYGTPETLMHRYEEALSVDGVEGIVIGTRPDCAGDDVLDCLEQLSRRTFVIVEYGIESTNDATLRRINRGHDFSCARRAIEATAMRGITVGAHVILGLPGENADDSLRQAAEVSSLPINILKIHQLQVIKGTRLAREYTAAPFPLYTPEEYVRLLTAYIQRLRHDIILDRFTAQAPANMILAPHWGLKNHEFADMLDKHMRLTGAYQGQLYNGE